MKSKNISNFFIYVLTVSSIPSLYIFRLIKKIKKLEDDLITSQLVCNELNLKINELTNKLTQADKTTLLKDVVIGDGTGRDNVIFPNSDWVVSPTFFIIGFLCGLVTAAFLWKEGGGDAGWSLSNDSVIQNFSSNNSAINNANSIFNNAHNLRLCEDVRLILEPYFNEMLLEIGRTRSDFSLLSAQIESLSATINANNPGIITPQQVQLFAVLPNSDSSVMIEMVGNSLEIVSRIY